VGVGREYARLPAIVALAVAGILYGSLAKAQRPLVGGIGREPLVRNIPYDGQFTFARIRYTAGPGGYYYGGVPAWAHGYATAERNLMKILAAISFLRPHVEETNAFALDDPELFKYPVAYMTEAGYWTMTDGEAAAFRAYLQKGGFAIFDDFRGGVRGGGGWENFAANIHRVLPGGRFVDLKPSDAIFHSFFEIDTFDGIAQYYDLGGPILRGVYEDNDPKRRLLMVVNFNTDVSNFWEFSATGFRPVDESNQAYKLGVNYVMYGLTH
jgi:hypothetical protein